MVGNLGMRLLGIGSVRLMQLFYFITCLHSLESPQWWQEKSYSFGIHSAGRYALDMPVCVTDDVNQANINLSALILSKLPKLLTCV